MTVTSLERPELNLISIFEAEALRLKTAAQEGDILHKTSNIRDSGEPLENSLKSLFERRLPSTYAIFDGYMHGEETRCSHQVDFMVARSTESHNLGPAGHESRYIHYNAVQVIGEIKKSAANFEHSLEQATTIVNEWFEFHQTSINACPNNRSFVARPCSFLFFAESAQLNEKTIVASFNKVKPNIDYVVFLDRSSILASKPTLFEYDGVNEGSLGFHDHRLAGNWGIYRPEPCNEMPAGRMLLWLYFAIASALNAANGNQSLNVDFTNRISIIYPMKRISWLDASIKFLAGTL